MKELALGIILIIILGIGGFLYQNAKENTAHVDRGSVGPVACTREARICPNGSTVGRVGFNCEFAQCPSEQIDFVQPEGFLNSLSLLSSFEKGRVAFFTKEPTVLSNSISVHVHEKAGSTIEDILLQTVRRMPADMPVESIDAFERVSLADREVLRMVVERFEATVEVMYAVETEDFVVLVSLRDISVENWMSEDFSIEDLEDIDAARQVVRSITQK